MVPDPVGPWWTRRSSLVPLELIRRHEQRHLGEVAPQQGVVLQLAHLHLGLQSGGTLDGRHQEEGPRLPPGPLHAEVAPPTAAGQAEPQRVAQHAGRGHPEQDARCWHVGHHRQEVEGDGARSLSAAFISQHARVPLTAPGNTTGEIILIKESSQSTFLQPLFFHRKLWGRRVIGSGEKRGRSIRLRDHSLAVVGSQTGVEARICSNEPVNQTAAASSKLKKLFLIMKYCVVD